MANALKQHLDTLLADTFVLYMETHNFHWNVTGPLFYTLHTLFEEQYNELWTATDDIAERIRTVGEAAPGTFAQYIALSGIEEPVGDYDAKSMLRKLEADHKACARTASNLFKVASERGDEATAALASDRMTVHEKTAWMLRSMAA